MLEKIRKLFKFSNIPITVILIVAGFLRIFRIEEYMTFLGDEGRDVLVVKHILDGFGALTQGDLSNAMEGLTLLGPTASVGGFFLGPIYYYMMSPFLLLFNYNPVGPAVMVALFGVATVLLLYIVTKDFFSYKSALAVSLIYALSPLVIIYSRSSWNPNVVPFFTLLMLYVLYHAVIKKSWKLFILVGVIFGILMQLHYLTTFLGVVIIIFTVLSSVLQIKKISDIFIAVLSRGLLIAFGFVVGWFPFLLFELRHGFPNITSIVGFVTESGDTGGNEKYFVIVNDIFFRLFGRLVFAFPRVEDLTLYPEKLLEAWRLGIYFVGVCSVTYIMFKLLKAIKQKKLDLYKYLLLTVWLFATLLLFGFYKKPIYDYYLVIVFPLPFLLIAAPLSNVIKKGRIAAWIMIMVVILIAILNLLYHPFRQIGNHQLRQVRTIAEFVLSQTDEKPFNFAVISGGGNSDHAYRYFFEAYNRHPITIEFPGVDPERNSVTDQLLIVCESVPCAPLGYPLWEVAGFGQADIAGRWPVSVVEVYKLEHYEGD